MSDRGKIRARRVSGNCAQHQREVAVAIKTARELALLPYTQRTVSERTGRGRGPTIVPEAGPADVVGEPAEGVEGAEGTFGDDALGDGEGVEVAETAEPSADDVEDEETASAGEPA